MAQERATELVGAITTRLIDIDNGGNTQILNKELNKKTLISSRALSLPRRGWLGAFSLLGVFSKKKFLFSTFSNNSPPEADPQQLKIIEIIERILPSKSLLFSLPIYIGEATTRQTSVMNHQQLNVSDNGGKVVEPTVVFVNWDAIAKRVQEFEDKYDFQSAIDFCNENILFSNSSVAGLFNSRGVVYFRFRQFDPAISDFKKALLLDRNDAVTHYNLGSSYYAIEEFSESARCFTSAIVISKNDIYTKACSFYKRGLSSARRGAISSSASDFRKAIKLKLGLREQYARDQAKFKGFGIKLPKIDNRDNGGKKQIIGNRHQWDHENLLKHRMERQGAYVEQLEALFKKHLNSDTKILEIGAGGGTLWLLSGFEFRDNWFSLDVYWEPLEYAKIDNNNDKFIQASAYQLPFENDSFDCILDLEVFSYFKDRKSLIKEIKRVLKPDGIIIHLDDYSQEPNEMFDMLKNIYKRLGMEKLFSFHEFPYWLLKENLKDEECIRDQYKANEISDVEFILLKECFSQRRKIANVDFSLLFQTVFKYELSKSGFKTLDSGEGMVKDKWVGNLYYLVAENQDNGGIKQRIAYCEKSVEREVINKILIVKFLSLISSIDDNGGTIKKCLVLDADGVLWEGTVGEDGIDGIKLTSKHLKFQRKVKKLNERGVILAINSKNNFEDVLEVLEKHPKMLLRKDDFVVIKANWQDKVVNMREIVQEINIGLDSIVFIDDNPRERELIRSKLSEVLVLGLSEISGKQIKLLGQIFDSKQGVITKEDRSRTELYKAKRLRDDQRQKADSLEDYYRALNMRVIIREGEENAPYMKRIEQLIQRTNQFSLGYKDISKYSLYDYVNFGKEKKIFTLQLVDKFEDNGIVGVIVYSFISGIDIFCLSCRAIGLTLEEAFMAYVIKNLKKLGVEIVKGKYLKTNKNALVRDMYAKFGFCQYDTRGENTFWNLDLKNSKVECPSWITIVSLEDEKIILVNELGLMSQEIVILRRIKQLLIDLGKSLSNVVLQSIYLQLQQKDKIKAIIKALKLVSKNTDEFNKNLSGLVEVLLSVYINMQLFCSYESEEPHPVGEVYNEHITTYKVREILLKGFISRLPEIANTCVISERFRLALNIEVTLGGLVSKSDIFDANHIVGYCPDVDFDETENLVRVHLNSVIVYLTKYVKDQNLIRQFIDTIGIYCVSDKEKIIPRFLEGKINTDIVSAICSSNFRDFFDNGGTNKVIGCTSQVTNREDFLFAKRLPLDARKDNGGQNINHIKIYFVGNSWRKGKFFSENFYKNIVEAIKENRKYSLSTSILWVDPGKGYELFELMDRLENDKKNYLNDVEISVLGEEDIVKSNVVAVVKWFKEKLGEEVFALSINKFIKHIRKYSRIYNSNSSLKDFEEYEFDIVIISFDADNGGSDFGAEHSENYCVTSQLKAKLMEKIHTNSSLSWEYKGKKIPALVRCGRVDDQFYIVPEKLHKDRHPELLALYAPVRDHWLPPAGTFGQIFVSIITISKQFYYFIEEIQPSRGYRKIKPRDLRLPYQSWAKASV
ncbi:MAG: HAD-IIIC family phosphatase, partial [Parcubacteria group bacterium]|nr:HAD-IIIC family phosphatase [Parcubacteria group bacterium]